MHIHAHIHVYTPIILFFNWGGKPLRSFLAVPQDVILLNIFQEFEIVKVDIVYRSDVSA